MKSQKEIIQKLHTLEGMMRNHIPTDADITQLRDYMVSINDKTISDEDRMKILLKIMSRPVETISLDAQLFILQWILYD